MILNLDERITNHIILFMKISAKLEDLLSEFTLNEISVKKIQALSKFCNESESDVQLALQGILKLMEEASCANLKEDEVRDTLKVVGMSADLIDPLVVVYRDIRPHVTTVNANKAITERSYVDLKWRIDIQLSSKLVGDNAQPIIYLHVVTKDPVTAAEQTRIFHTDPRNIRHLIGELQTAQEELDSVYCQRVVKYIR